MNKILTIVIPTYNMEKFLDRCLTSLIIDDDALMNLLEVIIVIDGSTDNSSKIAHTYERLYPQSFRVIDKENGNYGSCVNRGLEEAEGKYIKILDADDYFETREFAKMLQRLKGVQVDIVLSDYTIVNPTGEFSSNKFDLNDNEIIELSNYVDSVEKIRTWLMCNLTIRTQMMRDLLYHQTEGISYTDTEWSYFPLYKAKWVQYFRLNVYQYFYGREGQTMNMKSLEKGMPQMAKVSQRLINEYVSFDKRNLSYVQKYLIESHIRRTFNFMTLHILTLLPPKKELCLPLLDVDTALKQIPDIYREFDKYFMGEHSKVYYIKYWRKTHKDVRFTFIWKLHMLSQNIKKFLGVY